MKGIYLTTEGKQEIESKIAEIEEQYFKLKGNDDADEHYLDGTRTYLKEILQSATILPEIIDYCVIQEKYYHEIKIDDSPATKVIELFQSVYPQGVIIQPKQ